MLNIPNKSLFKINEVCGLTGVKPYVLRFWESEFVEIDPITSSTGQKLYEHKDIESIALIKKMLFDEKLNVEQAKMELALRLNGRAEEAHGDNDQGASKNMGCTELVQRMSLSEQDIKGLDQAKSYLRGLINKTAELQSVHHWN